MWNRKPSDTRQKIKRKLHGGFQLNKNKKSQNQDKKTKQCSSYSIWPVTACLYFQAALIEWDGRSQQPDCLHSLTAQGFLGNLLWYMSFARLLNCHCHLPGCCCVFILNVRWERGGRQTDRARAVFWEAYVTGWGKDAKYDEHLPTDITHVSTCADFLNICFHRKRQK